MTEEERGRHNEIQRTYYNNNKEEINRRLKEERNENKAIAQVRVAIPDIEYLLSIKPVKQLPTQKMEEKQGQTKDKYVAYIKAFYKEYTGEILGDEAEIIKKIRGEEYKPQITARIFKAIINNNYKEILIKYFKTIHILYSILRGIRGMTEEEKRLYPIVKISGEYYNKNRSKIKEKKEGAVSNIRFDEEEVYKNAELLGNKEDKILYCYTMLLHRRLYDLQHTIKIGEGEEVGEMNYIQGNKWYINKTKNKVKIVIELTERLMELVGKVEDNKYVLGRLFDKSTLTFRFNRITKDIYKSSYTPNEIRHIYITQINGDDEATFKGLKEEARKAGHTLGEQQNYIYKIEG